MYSQLPGLLSQEAILSQVFETSLHCPPHSQSKANLRCKSLASDKCYNALFDYPDL